jgi:hypothetical protein
MMKRKIVVIAVAALVIGGAAAAVAFWPSGDNKGWYAWDPTVGFELEYSKITATPNIIDSIEYMYKIAHGNGSLPELRPVPEGEEIGFTSLVEPAGDGIRINGTLRSSTGSPVNVPVEFTADELSRLKIISYGAGFTDSFVKMFEHSEESVWDTVVAAGRSTWDGYPNNGMRTENLGSEMFTLQSVEALNSLFKDREAAGIFDKEVYCIIAWGYISHTGPDNAHDRLNDVIIKNYKNVKVLYIDYYSIVSQGLSADDTLGNLLSAVDALGHLIPSVAMDDKGENKVIADFQNRLYTIKDAIPSDTKRTVYMELIAGTSPGAGTLAQMCFDILGLENIKKTPGTTKLSDEAVMTSEPDVIFFDIRDGRTEERKMRIVI